MLNKYVKKHSPCKEGARMFYPLRSGDKIIVGENAVVTHMSGSGKGFLFQFADDNKVGYEVHRFINWESVGRLAFFDREELERLIAEDGRAAEKNADEFSKYLFFGPSCGLG